MADATASVDAIVIGSGAFGSSTAYHLARRGLKTVLVDRHALGSQTSPRAAGLTSQADPLPVLARLRHEAFEGFFVASGCCVGGLGLSPAAGRALADLAVDGRSDPDLAPLGVERFRGRLETPAALEAACVAQYARRYTR